MPRRPLHVLALTLALVAVLATGCGGDDDETASTTKTARVDTAEGGYSQTQSIETVPAPKDSTNSACARVIDKAEIAVGDASTRARSAAPVEQALTNVVSQGAETDPRLKELATAHALLSQLYGGAGTSAAQAKRLAAATTRLEGRMGKLAAAAGVPDCRLDPVFGGAK